MFRVKQFKNAGNILPTAPHHIPLKLNNQQHCSDILSSQTMYAIGWTTIHYHVMDCCWTFTLGWMNPFCTFTKYFIPIQNEPFWVHSVYEGILKVLIELLSTVLKVFSYMCYAMTHLYYPALYLFFCEKGYVWWTSTCNYLHPAVLSSLLHLITPTPSTLFFKLQLHL